jgi:hypothetical protein
MIGFIKAHPFIIGFICLVVYILFVLAIARFCGINRQKEGDTWIE